MEGDHYFHTGTVERCDFNPLPPHGGRRRGYQNLSKAGYISIHSLRMEGDCPEERADLQAACISIHSLRMEGDHRLGVRRIPAGRFQSTPSAWRETV